MASKLSPSPVQPSPQTPNPPVQEERDDGDGARMGFFEHLEELRQRVFKALIALILGTIVGLVIATPLMRYLITPYCAAVGSIDQCRLVSLGPTGSVVSYFRVALMSGAILAIPVMTYQLLMFIVPGLTSKERRILMISIAPITLLFLVGAAFAWFVLMPPALGFLEGFEPTLFKPEWTSDLYLGFITSLIFWMGVAFESPLVFFVLALMGLVEAKFLIKNWRFAVVATAIIAAVITPTVDPVNMFLVMGPLLALYVLSIFLVIIGRRMSWANPPA